MKQTIFPIDFSTYYPIGIQPCPMYIDIANRIYHRIKHVILPLPDADELKKQIAINVAIYYEDKMSGIQLWNAFVAKHLLAYSHKLPFFDDCGSLENDDVNAKEVELLIWIVISRNFNDRFLNPIVMAEDTARRIMEVLTEDDEVDVNEELYNFVYNSDKADDYFKIKPVLMWLRRSYLLSSPLSEEKFNELKYNYSMQFNKSESIYYAETTFSTTTEIGPMAVKPHLWLADMYYENDLPQKAKRLMNLEYCEQDAFEVIEEDEEFVVLKRSTDETYKLKNINPNMFRKGSYICTALVKYADNYWEINGVMFKTSKDIFDKMHERYEKLKKSYEHAYTTYIERTKGKRLAFFEKTEQMKDWLKEISPEVDFSDMYGQLPDGAQVGFISKKAGLIFAPNIIHAIKCKDNPYYGKCDAKTMLQETMDAVINIEYTHPELLNYLLENNMLQDGDISFNDPSESGNKIFTRNIDFIARNHRRHHYHDHDY